jgi:uncharacterized protein (TIGR02996 family)
MALQHESQSESVTKSVGIALELYRANDQEAALDMLLDCWRENRANEVAAVIHKLSRRIAEPPLDGKTREKRLRQWLEIAETMTEADVDRLLTELPKFSRRRAEVCLDELETWLPDPRVSEALMSIIRDPPAGYNNAKSLTFWQELIKILEAHSAPSSSRRIYSLSLDHTESYGEGSKFLAHWLPLTARAVAQAFDDTMLSPEDQSCCEQFLKTMSNPLAPRSEEMLMAVYAEPKSDDLRSVLADALQEADDPRGEFVMLQMSIEEIEPSAEQSMRMLQLVQEHERAWLGPLEQALMSDVSYRRGFPVRGTVRKPELASLALPDWATFQDLDLSRLTQEEQSALLANPALRSLRVLRTNKIVVGGSTLAVEELHILKRRSEEPEVSIWTQCGNLPSLRLVRFEWAVRPEALRTWWRERGSMGSGLNGLVVCWGVDDFLESVLDAEDRKVQYLRNWNDEMQQAEFPLKRFTIEVDYSKLVFTRGNRAERWGLEIHGDAFEKVGDLLCCLPLGFLKSLHFPHTEESVSDSTAGRDSIDNLKRHLHSFSSIESVVLPNL